MWTTDVAVVKDPEARARLAALRDVIDTLDAAASLKRAEAATSPRSNPFGQVSLDRATAVINAALNDEHLKGIVAACELVVNKFKQEYDAAMAAQNKEPEDGHV